MRKTIRYLALLLAIMVLLSTTAFAADNDQVMPRESDLVRYYSSRLYVPSGNEIQIWFRVIGVRILDQIGAAKIEIQRSTDTQNWTTVATYTYADHSSMIATDTSVCNSYVSYYGEYGYYYRAKVTFWGQKGGAVYAPTIYTDTIYLAP